LPWAIARAVVGAAYALSRYRINHGHSINARGAIQTANGLLAFDGTWYRSIAEHGYGPVSSGALRFFPLFPITVRGLHLIVPLSWSLSTVLVANAAAFGAAMALYLLVTRDLHDRLLASRSVWLLCLGPASFVLVFGYAESLFLLLAIGTLWSLRRQSFWWAALFGLLASLTRPIGVLLVLPALVEVVLRWRRGPADRSASSLLAVGAPLLGFLGFCSWSAVHYGDFWAPMRIQEESSHHGGLSDPVVVTTHALNQVLHGHHLGTGLHVAWIALSLVLLVVAFRRLPLSYGVLATAIVLVAISGSNLDSFERYMLSAFPLTIAAATLMRSVRVATVVLIATGAAMAAYAFLALQGAYIP
jgi:hypothetical protein